VAVVPVHDAPAGLESLVGTLRRGGLEVCLVDDGSADGGSATCDLAEQAGATVVVRPVAGGPAAARNAARDVSPGQDLVVFLDADIRLEEPSLAWLWRCVAHFDDERVALVAPRVASPSPGARAGGTARAVEAYEALGSPLDLGPDPGLVGAGRRLSYVPAAALVARRRALDGVGWFDEALRYGEDVDLVRRLERTGWMCRYEPQAVVVHPARAGVVDFARQRAHYGSSAAALDAKHPGTVAPFASHPAIATAAAAVVGTLVVTSRNGTRIAGALVASGASALVARRLSTALERAGCPRPAAIAARLTVRSVAASYGGLLTAFRRAWWPLALPLLLTRRGRRRLAIVAGASVLAGPAPAAVRAARGHGLRPFARHLGIAVVDDAAYSAGVWWGCWRRRSFRALLPRVRATPTGPRGR
jgi:mycofactocin system glycosyltransferase